MSILINPGSRIPANSGQGWTNTIDGARKEAIRWLVNMRGSGLTEIELLPDAEPTDDGSRWTFQFRHPVTGVVVTLETHGIDDLDAYQQECIFAPRSYWKGSSCSNPEISDWVTDGYEVVHVLRPVEPYPRDRRADAEQLAVAKEDEASR